MDIYFSVYKIILYEDGGFYRPSFYGYDGIGALSIEFRLV